MIKTEHYLTTSDMLVTVKSENNNLVGISGRSVQVIPVEFDHFYIHGKWFKKIGTDGDRIKLEEVM